MNKTLLSIAFVALMLSGCGHQGQFPSSGTARPPSASVTIGNQHIPTVINGYQWSNAYGTTVADAANDPAKNLKKYPASSGAKATLSFDKAPKSMQLAMWSNGSQISKSALSGNSFDVPTQSGDYTYELTGQWGSEYVNYDFEVEVR